MGAELAAELASLDPLRLALIAGLTFAGSVVSGLSGMGGGVLIAMAIAPVIGIKPLVPTVAVAMLVNHVVRVWVFRREAVWPSVAAVLITAVPATVAGSLLYVALAPEIVAIVIGVFLLTFVPLRRTLVKRAWRVGRKGLAAAGALYGFVSGTTIGGGMLIIPALLGTGLTGAALVSTDAFIGLAILLTKTTAFGTAELLTPRLAFIGVVIGVCSIPGIYFARWLIAHTSVKLHTLFIEALILIGGASFLWRGASAL